MSKTLQFRRGTTSELSTIAGAVGELFVDTTKDTVVVMDGSTAGGFPLATESSLSSIQSSLQSSINAKADSSSLATVATSGSYNDLSNRPNIPTVPTNLSAFNNDSGFITISALQWSNISGIPFIPSATSELNNDAGFATVMDITNAISTRQATLVSGSNIKSINGQSILGSGNLVITGDGSVLDLSAYATKTDLLILDSDDIDEGLINQYYTNQKVANVLLNGTHSNISFSFNGSTLNATVAGGTEVDNFKVKNAITMQQKATPLATVTSKSIIPATSEYVEYVSNSSNPSTNQIYNELKYNYGYFYNSYADIYSDGTTTEKIRELFAPGNTVRITRNGYWWDLQITSISSNFTVSNANISYTIIGTDSPWNYPGDGPGTYWNWDYNISFSSNLPIPQKNILNVNATVPALSAGDKLLINGSQTATPYALTVNSIGTWDYGINGGGTSNPDEYYVDFGSNSYNSNQQDLRDLLTVGTTITLSDNTWSASGVYLVTAVGAEKTWNTPNGIRVVFQFVSGTNYPQVYTSMPDVFNSRFSSASGTVTPNYTTKYLSRFATLNNSTSYVSFDNYDFLSIGDVLSYIPATTSIQFKNDAGNNVKAISYNNSTGAITYDGIVQALEYSADTSSLWSINANSEFKAGNIASSHSSVISIGNNAKSFTDSIAIGKNSNVWGTIGSVAIGTGASANNANSVMVGTYANASGGNEVVVGTNASSNQYLGIAIGYNARAHSPKSTAIGSNAYAYGGDGTFVYASTTDGSYLNQTVKIQFSSNNANWSSGFKYIGVNYKSYFADTPNSDFYYRLYGLGGRADDTMAIATAQIMYKPVNDNNNDDVKIEEIKFVVRTTSYDTWVIDTISTNLIYGGSGTMKDGWSTAFEIYQNKYLTCKVTKNNSTNFGYSAKISLEVLSTQ